MFDKLDVNMKRVYPTLVVSTMSSGKSTLINALVGNDLLPSRNRACTSKAVAILDNDMQSEFVVHTVDKEGKYRLLKNVTKKIVKDFNETNDVSEMIIEGQIKGIKNSKKSLFIIDTPGVNNGLDLSHSEVTKEVVDEYSEGLILYLINAQQIGTYDDNEFLYYISKKIENNPNYKIIFIINKMDIIDPSKESPVELVENCKKYIESFGINQPIVIPVSANASLIFKKALYGYDLTEMEEEEFSRYYKRFKNTNYSLVNYAFVPERGNLNKKIKIDDICLTRAEIYGALYNTGLTYLEMVIDEMLVKSLKMRAPKVKKKKWKEVVMK